METGEIIEKGKKYLMNTYGKLDVAFTHGNGVYVYDNDGNKYVDFVAGIAVNNLGHSDVDVVKAIKDQADKIIHTSNMYYIEPQVKLAELLVENSIFDKAFFCNSGAEANEGAIKLARKYGKQKLNGNYEIITMKKSFHGRTITTITATGQEKYQKDFTPLTEGFVYAEYGNIDDIKSKITEKTLAVMIEVVQGEGGVNICSKEFWEELQKTVKEKGILLILDEVQTGIGRTGNLFGYELYNLEPDIITLAKALGNGMPIGAVLAKEEVAVFVPGDHASTFGGNFLATAAGIAVIKKISNPEFIYDVRKKGEFFRDRLEKLGRKYGFIKEVRGKGLMIGAELDGQDAKPIVDKMYERKILINAVGGKVLRFVPPLTVTKEEIDYVIKNLDEVFQEISEK